MIEKLKTDNEQLFTKVDGFKNGGIELISEEQITETFKE